jgi:hypothetical protein
MHRFHHHICVVLFLRLPLCTKVNVLFTVHIAKIRKKF